MQQATVASPDGRQHERRNARRRSAFPGAWTKDPDAGDTSGTRCACAARSRWRSTGRAASTRRWVRHPRRPHGDVLAEGWHRGAGTRHAEIDALSKLAPGAARGATAVVTLEPCNHHGRTGPCSEALLAAGVARVVYAIADPGVHSAGGGERLRTAGVDVESGLFADEAAALLRLWLTRAAPRPAARHREVGAEPRRPGGGIRRHQPVDHRT